MASAGEQHADTRSGSCRFPRGVRPGFNHGLDHHVSMPGRASLINLPSFAILASSIDLGSIYILVDSSGMN